MARLFPVTIIRECELPASSPTDPPYVFGYSPHGFMSFGANLAFATEACGFARLFPGMHLRYLSIYSNLRVPLFHDFVLALGGCSVSRRSISHILQHGGAGRACMLVVGGIAEAKLAQPGTADLVLRRRRGFVRIAIQHGASLVPVFGFGENDIYDPVPPDSASWTHSLLRLVMRTTGFRYPLFSGRSLFSAAGGGLIPHFRPVTIVVGKPIPTTLAEDPADDVVDHVHQLYIAELQRIYDKYKDIYAPHRIRDMHIVS